MTVAELIAALQKLPPETIVVKFHEGPEGFDDVWFIMGTHQGHGDESNYLRINRAKRVKGIARPDYLSREIHPSRSAQRIPFVVLT